MKQFRKILKLFYFICIMENCIFCKIIKGEIPYNKVYEDEKILAFLDINPVNYGHVLVIPKKHFQWFYEVPDKILSYLTIKSKDIVIALKKTLKPDYVALSVVGLDVPHFHLHLIPRWKNDGMDNFWPTKKYKDNEEKEYAEKIRKEID